MSRRAVGLFATLMLICVFGCGSDEEPEVTLPDDSGSDEEVVILPKPVILDVAVAAITRTEAVIRWTTDVPGTSHVEYGVTSAYGSRTQVDWRFVTEHEATLERLSIGETYHFRVASLRQVAGEAAFSDDETFATRPPIFSENILPILRKGCNLGLRCHAEAFGLSELKLDSYDGMMKGGVNGPPILAGQPEQSLLYRRITGQVLPQMPLDNAALRDSEIELIRKWIAAGALND